MVDAIIEHARKGYHWIPAEEDRRGRLIPLESFLEMKKLLVPHCDNEHVRFTLMHTTKPKPNVTSWFLSKPRFQKNSGPLLLSIGLKEQQPQTVIASLIYWQISPNHVRAAALSVRLVCPKRW